MRLLRGSASSPPKWPSTNLSDQNPGGILYEIIFVLNANSYENINAHY